MSVKDFYSSSVLKQTALDFLKCKADFSQLGYKHKKPFRGLLQMFESDSIQNYHTVSTNRTYVGPFCTIDAKQREFQKGS